MDYDRKGRDEKLTKLPSVCCQLAVWRGEDLRMEGQTKMMQSSAALGGFDRWQPRKTRSAWWGNAFFFAPSSQHMRGMNKHSPLPQASSERLHLISIMEATNIRNLMLFRIQKKKVIHLASSQNLMPASLYVAVMRQPHSSFGPVFEMY